MALKAALRDIGIEALKTHDVEQLLRGHQDKFPASFRQQIERLAAISRRLRMEREVSFYGDEETGASSQELYGREDATGYLKEASHVLDQCAAFLKDRNRKP